MAFPSDGRNHSKAIKSEKNLIDFKKEIENFYNKPILEISHIGGTQNKVDNTILFIDESKINISLKDKEDIRSGSFDYVNTSNFDWNSNGFTKSLNIYSLYRGSKNVLFYKQLTNAISSELSIIPDDILTKLFINNVYDKYESEKIDLTIIDKKTGKIFCGVIPPVFNLIKNGGKLTIKKTGRNTCSYIVEGIDINNNKVNLGLRIRVHLNNGKTKWINGGSSQLVIKFQQDKVHSFLLIK
jgi:hypothetical protein